ncbi:SubName: Full=Uncharacterized protein {ECO:0000313/EMBL:CCA66939.1} [Serendipita indica DSM 11827]|nr:SubName: Full=Uncharacterized protein {ECO:0000313/EMBL:CCA66939.1} [Serendipita indica DSM 11827]
MNGENSNTLSPGMCLEDEGLLNKTIASGEVENWEQLREVLTKRIAANVQEFLQRGSDPLIERSNLPATTDGLVLPPFKPRANNPAYGPTRTLPSEMTEQEAKDMLEIVVNMLEGFADSAPFTIKRVCELALLPRNHYRTVGKYLRGLEKTLLVTSSPQTFSVASDDGKPSVYSTLGMEGVLKTVSTPIFEPIPFLHDDARRRSQSRSPPASPLRLHNSLAMSEAPADEPKGFGLVDELDTPAPGHMASKPNPLTATTSSEPSTPLSDPTALPSLSDRFVKEGGDEKEAEKKETEVQGGGEENKNEDAEVEVMVLSQEGSDP